MRQEVKAVVHLRSLCEQSLFAGKNIGYMVK